MNFHKGQSLMRAATSCCAWVNSIYRQEPITVSWSYPAPSQIWRGAKRSSTCIYLKPYNRPKIMFG